MPRLARGLVALLLPIIACQETTGTVAPPAYPRAPAARSTESRWVVLPPIEDDFSDGPDYGADVIAALRPDFLRCYDAVLNDRHQTGSIRITAKIAPNGDVTSAAPTSREGLSDQVVACLLAVVMRARFAPPAGGVATVTIPLTFEGARP